jgi:hypothetical protein
MIVKVQASLFSSDGKGSCLIYNETRDIQYETSDPKEIKPIMAVLKGRPKVYFEAEVVNTKIELRKEVKTQNW